MHISRHLTEPSDEEINYLEALNRKKSRSISSLINQTNDPNTAAIEQSSFKKSYQDKLIELKVFVASVKNEPLNLKAFLEYILIHKSYLNNALLNANDQDNLCSSSFEEVVFKMGNFIKILKYLDYHKKVLLSEGIENRDVEDYEKDNFFNTVYKKVVKDLGNLQHCPPIKAVFKIAGREMKKKEKKKKKESWKTWFHKKKGEKEIINYDINVCSVQCDEDEHLIPSLKTYISNIERKLLINYPELQSKRVIKERKTGIENLKYMCPSNKGSSTSISSGPNISSLTN